MLHKDMQEQGKVGVAIALQVLEPQTVTVADAQIDSTPMVCITGQVGKHLLGSDAFQERILGFQLNQMELSDYRSF
jgi:thiamine pyrophosphate-dependent acetolactate synthase large subunit-like protein